MLKQPIFLLFKILIISVNYLSFAQAEIVTDGSLGNRVP